MESDTVCVASKSPCWNGSTLARAASRSSTVRAQIISRTALMRSSAKITVRSVFPNEARLLHSGASGAVIIPSTYENCIVIPQEATIRLQDKTMVYKVVDGKAVSSLITVAELNDGREYVVLDGLKAGEEIVSQGAGLVREGTQVK